MSTTDEVADKLKALADIVKERGAVYGPPDRNFANTAKLWSAFMQFHFTPSQVCVLLALVKVARLMEDELHMDSYDDAANYMAIAGVISGLKSDEVV